MTGSACKFIFSEHSAGSFRWIFVARLKKLNVVEKGRSLRRGWLPCRSSIRPSADDGKRLEALASRWTLQ